MKEQAPRNICKNSPEAFWMSQPLDCNVPFQFLDTTAINLMVFNRGPIYVHAFSNESHLFVPDLRLCITPSSMCTLPSGQPHQENQTEEMLQTLQQAILYPLLSCTRRLSNKQPLLAAFAFQQRFATQENIFHFSNG